MSVKIIHTADWHIGKKLHEYSLNEDHRMFMDWLMQLIEEEKIDYLLISGDVFDLANPSQESLAIYYRFLAKLSTTDCKAIITAGNHDSPKLIDAPSELLNALEIKVIGNVPADISELLIPLKDKSGKTIAAIAAVPYLLDRDIRKAIEGESYDDRVQAVRLGIQNFYARIGEVLRKAYSGMLHLAMGHLYVQGVVISDSERQIQIGNLAGVDASMFPSGIHYVALGHIHKAQNVGSDRIRYSGSPIPLSFSEKKYDHRVILLELDGDTIEQKDIPVKKFRELVGLNGTIREVREKAMQLKNEYPLPILVDLQIEEDEFNPQMHELLDELLAEIHASKNAEVIHRSITYKNSPLRVLNPSSGEFDRNELTPEKIFKKLISGRELEEQDKLMQLFFEIKQEAEEKGSK
ncbi:MAG: exonuclease subunit SbcD [Cytophagaceae bacterium]